MYGGSDFKVHDSSDCDGDGFSEGFFLFDGTYFCGDRLVWENMFFNDEGEDTIPRTPDFIGGGQFGVYASLVAAARDGISDATQTLTLSFRDDEGIMPVEIPGGVVVVLGPVTFGLLVFGLLALGPVYRSSAPLLRA